MSDERFGVYRIVETLGQGAVTTLYRAVQEPLGRVVVVKALKSEIAPTSSFGVQIEREAKLLADLAHPNIVLALDHGRGPGGRPFLTLEHVDGPSLEVVLAKKRRLPPEVALAVALGVCEALEHAHDRGVVHRDVKPGNVLLGKTGVVKLIDFGIAQRVRGEPARDAFETVGVTPSGRISEGPLGDGFGTPAYMAPEQILGDFADERSDLFSLGVVLYQMLSGARPWERRGAEPRGGASTPPLRREAPLALRERAPELPRTLERLVMRLLEPTPAARHPSASALRERLEAALRATTRQAPAEVVRAGLAEAGFAPKAVRTSAAAAGEELRPPWSMGRAMAGFAAVAVLFGAFAWIVARPSRAGMRAPAASALAPADLATGSGLRVLASPWAHVRVDGAQVETTPFARPIPLAAGKHWVQLVHPESPPVEREIEIGEGQVVTLDVTMPVGSLDGGAGKEIP